MSLNKYRFALRTRSFLDAHAADRTGMVELSPAPDRQLLVWNPEAVGEIFRSEQRMVLEGSDTLGPLVGEHSMLFANGQRHAAYRKVVGTALRGRRLAAYRGVIAEATDAALGSLAPGTTFSLPEWTRALTLRIIGRIVLGHAEDETLGPFTKWVEYTLGSRARTLAYRHLRGLGPLPSPWRTFQRDRAEIVGDLLRASRAGGSRQGREPGGKAAERTGEPPTIAGLLTSGEEPLGPMGDEELSDQLISLLFAGHETTASAIAWTLFWLHRDERVRHDVLAELEATTDDGSTTEAVPLLNAVCQEALRISPPATVAGNRMLTSDWRLLDRPEPAGTRLTPCIALAHRSPEIYPDPGRFDPGRFLGAPRHAQEYLPFGGGTRRCLGANLAMLEMRMVVAAVLRRHDLRCLNPEAAVPHLRGPAMGPGPLRMAVGGCPMRAGRPRPAPPAGEGEVRA
ncbi:cytochrome P450 [Streptosporangium sp. LJ11]|uniref:cytochrome P450 n=1 Tax=Streptosporangium sp. LJ11 TaxID=3436927 RepID=UPI003F7B14D8